MASAASIRDRLKNFARASNADVGMLIKRYGGEAIMRRVAMHDRADAFILKGASLFAMTDQALVRTTADVDFGIKLCVSGLGELEDLMRGILAQDANDGVEFLLDTFQSRQVREDESGDIEGIKLIVDFRFGSAVERALLDVQLWKTPMPELPPVKEFASLLPGTVSAPRLRMMPWEYVVAEKLCASVEDGGPDTIRIKDAYDIRAVLPHLDGASLADALRNTFRERLGFLPSAEQIPLLTDAYAAMNGRAYADWARGKKLACPPPLAEAVAAMRSALGPLIDAVRREGAEARPALAAAR